MTRPTHNEMPPAVTSGEGRISDDDILNRSNETIVGGIYSRLGLVRQVLNEVHHDDRNAPPI